MIIIFGENYQGYKKSFQKLNLDTFYERRENLCLRSGKKCTLNEKIQHMFLLNIKNHSMKTRKQEKFRVNHARSVRYQNSPVIKMQNLLNNEESLKINT